MPVKFMFHCMKILAFHAAVLSLFGCSPGTGSTVSHVRTGVASSAIKAFHSVGEINLGEPLGVTVDFQGNMFVADGIPGRIVRFSPGGDQALEFQSPSRSPGFYPCDLKLQGFFVYAVDEVNRTILRFDKEGAYRDILINLNEDIVAGRVSPFGLDVDGSGRIAVTDVENHRILVFDAYLSLELSFGSYGTFQGQLNSPEGVTFADDNRLVVADSGNRRIEIFDGGGTFLKIVPAVEEDNPMMRPRRAVMDDNGNLYVADPAAGAVFSYDKDGKLVKSIYPEGAGEFQPTDVEIDDGGRLYVTDVASRTLFIFKVI
jgi:tripartite motif-containing protein 71